MESITINLYEFSELKREVRERARRKVATNSEFVHALNDDLHDYVVEQLKERGYESPNPRYSLSNSQGDGLSFSADGYEHLEKLLEKHNLIDYKLEINVIYAGSNWRYPFAEESHIYYEEEVPENKEENLEAFIKEIKSTYMTHCLEVERLGYKYIEQCESEENISLYCDSNNIWFLNDGSIAPDTLIDEI